MPLGWVGVAPSCSAWPTRCGSRLHALDLHGAVKDCLGTRERPELHLFLGGLAWIRQGDDGDLWV